MSVWIFGNHITINHYGIWLGVRGNVSATLYGNTFRNVKTHVFRHH